MRLNPHWLCQLTAGEEQLLWLFSDDPFSPCKFSYIRFPNARLPTNCEPHNIAMVSQQLLEAVTTFLSSPEVSEAIKEIHGRALTESASVAPGVQRVSAAGAFQEPLDPRDFVGEFSFKTPCQCTST